MNAITLEQFCDQFNTHFNSDSNASKMPYALFEAIFKSMTTMDEASIEAITQFMHYLDENKDKVKCLLVSHTNNCQFMHILSQLPAIQYKVIDDEVIDLPEENMLFATSMQSKAELHPQTFGYALDKLKLNLDDADITYVSFLNTIPASEHIQYINPYIGTEKKLNISHVIELIDTVALGMMSSLGMNY